MNTLKLILFLLPFPALSYSQVKENLLKQAYVLYTGEQYELSLKEVNKLIAIDSTVADYYDLRAEIYYRLKNITVALEDYSKAISLNSTDPVLYHHRAIVFYTTQNPEYAIGDNNTALRYVGGNDSLKHIIYLNRGNAYGMKRDFQSAYEDYSRMLIFDSTNLAALTGMGAVLDDLGRGEEAIAYFEKVIRLYPKNIGGYGNLAFRYLDKGDYKKALELNNKVLQLDPNDPSGYNNRGHVKYKMNDLQGALKDINKSLSLYPENSYAYKNRALVYIALKQEAKASRIWKRQLHTALPKCMVVKLKN